MTYILIFPIFNSEEVYYCESLEKVKQTIEDTNISQEEIQQVRVFKIEKEINAKRLFDENQQ